MSSASRTGSQNGSTTAASMIGQLLGSCRDRRGQHDRRRQMVVFGAVVLGQHGDDRSAGFRPCAHVDGGRRTDRVVGAPDEGARISNRTVNTENGL